MGAVAYNSLSVAAHPSEDRIDPRGAVGMSSKQITQILVGSMGALNTIIALLILFVPVWFFEKVGNFPPFNRHYMGDAGTFLLAIGIGLLLAARDPMKHKLTVGVGLLASALHTLNHLYDAIIGGSSIAHAFTDLAPLVLFVIILAAAYAQMRPAKV